MKQQGNVSAVALVTAAVVCVLVLLRPVAAETRTREGLIDSVYASWLPSVEHLASSVEIAQFEGLTDALAKERAIRSFWARRDPRAMYRWRSNLEDARALYPDPRDQRRNAVQIAGRPATIRRLEQCGAVIRELELWTYSGWQQQFQSSVLAENRRSATDLDEEGFSLLFFRTGRDPIYQWWSPGQGIEALTLSGPNQHQPWDAHRLIEFGESSGCFRARRFGSTELTTALGREQTIGLLHGVQHVGRDPGPASGEPANRGGPGAVGQTGAEPLSTAAAVTALGEHQGRTVVRGLIRVPVSVISRNAANDVWDRLVLSADVWQGTRLVQSFRSVFYLSGSPPSDALDLDFFRLLRPGTYRLALRLADRYGRAHLRSDQQLVVAAKGGEIAPAPRFFSAGWTEASRDEVGRLLSFPTLELVAPAGTLGPGRLEIRANAVGAPIAAVVFTLDGVVVGQDEDPPFEVELDLLAGQPQVLMARAMSAGGRIVAVDELELDPRPVRFDVELRVDGNRGLVRTSVPSKAGLDEVEVFLDDTLLESRAESSFDFAVPAAPSGERRARLLRVVASTLGGDRAEDVVVLDPGLPSEEIDVRLVELTMTVLDKHGRLVTDLEQDEIHLYEDGEQREILAFETVATRPINVALLLDSSGSMRGRIRLASRSAERFVTSVLGPEDRAALLEFNHDIRVRAPFGSEIEHLRYAASGLRAAGTTRLNDSIIFTLHGFGGLEHRRALVLLSDGRDVDSDSTFQAVLEAALRARVVVFPIALDLEDDETSDHLVELATVTGGSFFSVQHSHELPGVFARIEEELRSQYYVVFESPARPVESHGGLAGEFRALRVEIPSRQRAEVRTIHGYYR